MIRQSLRCQHEVGPNHFEKQAQVVDAPTISYRA
jgi:hypothetical protein